jgi:hypothetical protein
VGFKEKIRSLVVFIKKVVRDGADGRVAWSKRFAEVNDENGPTYENISSKTEEFVNKLF